jgi:hypothetical protein
MFMLYTTDKHNDIFQVFNTGAYFQNYKHAWKQKVESNILIDCYSP